jgi:hypothetical protein
MDTASAVTALVLIRIFDGLSVLLAVAGIGISLYTARDNRLDLAAYRRKGLNGYAELTAQMGVRGSHSAGVLHGVLGLLAAVGFGGTPSPDRYLAGLAFYAGFLFAQGWAVRGQLLNQIDRRRIRRKLGERR